MPLRPDHRRSCPLSSQRRAYTAIELLISVALGVIIVLLAASALRMTTQAIGVINRLSGENQLLTTGYLVSLDDADFWHSAADPDFPWARKAQSLADVDRAGNAVAATSPAASNPNNKRLFRPVAFSASSPDQDPSWVLPHDPRSWYRNHLAQNPRPIRTNGNGFGADNSNSPAGFSPRSVFGDYAALANLGMSATSDGGARPALMMRLFQQLGLTGVVDYLPRGTMTIVLRPDRSASDLAMPSQAMNYDQGEIPWSLAPRNSKNKRYRDADFSLVDVTLGGDPAYAVAIADKERTHYFEALMGRWAGSGIGIDRTIRYENSALPFKHWATDFDWITWRDALVFGSLHVPRSGGGWDDTYIVQPLRRPFRSATDWSDDGKGHSSALLNNELWTDYGSTTVLVPAALSGPLPPDLGALPKDQSILAIASFRYVQGCAAVQRHRVQVSTPSTGQILALEFAATSTTWRGARQHWGAQRAPRDAALRITGQGDMGDWYAP